MEFCKQKEAFKWKDNKCWWSYKASVYKVLEDRELLGTVSMAKLYNKAIVLEFYGNLKFDISDAKSPNY